MSVCARINNDGVIIMVLRLLHSRTPCDCAKTHVPVGASHLIIDVMYIHKYVHYVKHWML